MDYPHFVLARFYEHIGPIDRGDRYEDPLSEVRRKYPEEPHADCDVGAIFRACE